MVAGIEPDRRLSCRNNAELSVRFGNEDDCYVPLNLLFYKSNCIQFRSCMILGMLPVKILLDNDKSSK